MKPFQSFLLPGKDKILVTGGAGFIGSHVVDRLLELGFTVTVLDRIKQPYRNDINFLLGDIRDKMLINQLARDHAGIINLAAILGTSETIEHPESTVTSNFIGALNIFEAAKNFGIRVTHITVGNYWMNNPYAITKNAAEKLALLYNSQFNTKITVVRGLNAYGERQKDYPVRKIMPNLVIPALKNTEILIFGDGKQRMDMIYVTDLAEILVRALLIDHGTWDTILEAGSGKAPTINEICETVLKITGSHCKVKHIPMRKGEPPQAIVCGNPSTLAPLGILAEDLVSLEKGTRKTVEYYTDYLLSQHH